MLFNCVVMTVIGYFSGSLMFSYFIPKILKGVDIRKIPGGDGNPGSSNAIRAAGLPIGIVCMALDVLKAFVPVFVAVSMMNLSDFYLVPVVVSPVFGHAFSPFLGFKGGKAISTVYGSLLALWPISKIVILIAALMFIFKFVIVIHPDSSCVLVAICFADILVIIFEPVIPVKLAFLIISVVVIFKLLKQPDHGVQSISLLHFWSIDIEEKKLKIHRI